MPKSPRAGLPAARPRAFTLIELLVAMAVLVLLFTFIAQMTNGVSTIVNRGQAQIDTDGQARAVLDRMAIDFAAMVKRPDVDYFLKGRPAELTQGADQLAANDQIAFYSEVPGYFPSANGAQSQSSVSVVGYRVNSATMHLERLCKGVAWDVPAGGNPGSSGGAGSTPNPSMGFLPVPLASPLPLPLPSPMPATPPLPLFPTAADPVALDLDYEELGPQVFRFEYYYVLKGQSATSSLPVLSITPWYAKAPVSHTAVNGMQDVAGVGVLIAVIDPKSRKLLTRDQLLTLAGQMKDAPDPANPSAGIPSFTTAGDIEAQWNSAVSNSTIPRPVAAAIRIYTRCFYLNGVSP